MSGVETEAAGGLCRDCGQPVAADAVRCPACASPRLLFHPELHALTLAHLDCDAFYASVEKRDDPSLADKPVIVGGGKRGVVSTCCYVARMYGVRSAMPMFQALERCPDAVVIRPNMSKYAAASRQVRALLDAVTPLVEPLSLDEAFLDLGGTERLHHGSAAATLVQLSRRIEAEIGITVSIGLAPNKFLAKLASDLDKPRGFSVIGRAEVVEFLAPRKVTDIWGVGQALARRLAQDGITRIGQLQGRDPTDLMARYGSIGLRLARFSVGRDDRKVEPVRETKSVSAETTFFNDYWEAPRLAAELWPLCETVARRLKKEELAGRTVTLKLKTADFRLRTRAVSLAQPTQLAEVIYRAAQPLLEPECDGTAFRLIGVGVSHFGELTDADQPSLFDPSASKRADVERAMDQVRQKFGSKAINKGRGLSTSAPAADRGSSSPPSPRNPHNR